MVSFFRFCFCCCCFCFPLFSKLSLFIDFDAFALFFFFFFLSALLAAFFLFRLSWTEAVCSFSSFHCAAFIVHVAWNSWHLDIVSNCEFCKTKKGKKREERTKNRESVNVLLICFYARCAYALCPNTHTHTWVSADFVINTITLRGKKRKRERGRDAHTYAHAYVGSFITFVITDNAQTNTHTHTQACVLVWGSEKRTIWTINVIMSTATLRCHSFTPSLFLSIGLFQLCLRLLICGKRFDTISRLRQAMPGQRTNQADNDSNARPETPQ